MVNYSYQPIENQHENMKTSWFKPKIDPKKIANRKPEITSIAVTPV